MRYNLSSRIHFGAFLYLQIVVVRIAHHANELSRKCSFFCGVHPLKHGQEAACIAMKAPSLFIWNLSSDGSISKKNYQLPPPVFIQGDICRTRCVW